MGIRKKRNTDYSMTQRLLKKLGEGRVVEYWHQPRNVQSIRAALNRNAGICKSLRPPLYEQQVRLETKL